ncbi:hypothetical protein EMPS_03105 [Entomortierella parvispora]|uniref:Smr domain-containing protein n=1 Tax=Entomortierella parvispora TaxID=205924 RepID=A0A9P3H5Z8_9FUNG|nr:hypothetical protein EMPS_03105 [Entomortierella parvispora]
MDPQEKLEAMFCPRLDSALVASIYHDLRDFKACIPILSALAAASPATTTSDATFPETSSKNTSGATTSTKTKTGNKSTAGEGTSSLANLNGKKSSAAPTKDKNILIWSEQVASSTSDNSASPLGYKQGQITNSSSYRAPTSSVASATPTSVSQGGAATTTAPAKQAFRALRNPNFVRNNGLPPGMEMPPMPGAFPIDETLEDEQEEQGQDDVSEDDVAAEIQQQQPSPKKKKNRRPKRSGKVAQQQQQPTVTSPSAQASPRRTWKKSADGQYAFEEKILDQFASLDLDAIQTSPSPSDNLDNENEFESEEMGTDEVAGIYSERTNNSANDISSEELEFLKSCFPDRQHSDEFLAQIFKDSRRDLEAAVELILSRMFLENEQVETSSTGSVSLNSTGSHASSATTASTGSLDDAFFQGVQKSKKKTKAWNGQELAWGGAGIKPRMPSPHIPGLTDKNDPLLNAIDRQDGFLLPESNEWATFDHQISILMNIFHTVPKKTIVSAYHANGTQLFKTVDYLENQLKNENYGGSAEGQQRQRDFDINLAQLMEIFPDKSAQGLKKMLVLQGGNLQETMNAVLASDLAQSDHDLQQQRQQQQRNGKRGATIPLQADIRYADKTVTAATSTSAGTSRLRTLPSTNNPYPGGPRPFPNTLLDKSNAELYNDDDDPIWCRQRAHEVLEQRNELFRKAAKAYQATKGKGAGMGGIAAYYADEGKKLDVQGKQWHMRAARAVVQQHRVENNDPNLVDLHGLTIAEAQTVVREAVTQWFSRSTMQASRIAGKPLKIICGVGSHSKDRIARLYPTILSLLMKDGWRCEAENGVIFVKGVSRIMPGNKK